MTAAAVLGLLGVGAGLLGGVWAFSMLDRAAASIVAGRRPRFDALAPVREAALLLVRQRNRTERPDGPAWLLAPALYAGLAATGLAVVPWSAATAPSDVAAGIVLWGAIEALVVICVFLNGWSANAPLALIGGYRYVVLGLSMMLVSMFVLIAAALPAESLRVSAIVESQATVWNVIRQPLGLPLFLFVGLTLGFLGPLDFADSADLAGGTAAELSGPSLLVWQFARRAMLVAFSAMAATVWLGGWLGPALPGPAWLALKTLAILAVLALLGRLTARVATGRIMPLVWLVLLPLSFLDLIAAGIEALR